MNTAILYVTHYYLVLEFYLTLVFLITANILSLWIWCKRKITRVIVTTGDRSNWQLLVMCMVNLIIMWPNYGFTRCINYTRISGERYRVRCVDNTRVIWWKVMAQRCVFKIHGLQITDSTLRIQQSMLRGDGSKGRSHDLKEKFEDTKGASRRKADNTMDNRKRTKSQTMINKPLHRKINIEQHAPN